jgi:hypothetical protein
MKLTKCVVAAALMMSAALASPAAIQKKPVIQLAILLDTSNSMDGLIDQARTQLWRVVNELASAKKGGVNPDLRVALYEYGNSALSAESGYVRRVLPLTSDLDRVSEELFALKTNGGEEYCGTVIAKAARGLDWSDSNADLKLIFIAGNEPFTQGSVDYHQSCRAAIAKGIVVNTIFCGDRQEGINTHWKDGADLADGRFATIDQNEHVVDVVAPQDKEIASLGLALNKTYIAYGAAGKEGAARQTAQDANSAAAAPAANVERQLAKSKAAYSNSSWDLVDAKAEGGVAVEKVATKDLPAEMQKMTVPERKAYVETTAKKRAELQTRLKKLEEERKKYVATQALKTPAKSTLDTAVISTVRDQGAKKGYKFQ